MEFSQDALIDVGLSVAGYLAAGGLWMVLYSLFTGRTRTQDAVPQTADQVNPETSAAIGRAVREKRSLQYVDLRETKKNSTPVERPTPEPARVDQYRRNRAEVVRLAREMLKDGRSRDQVRELLPISEGELALLAQE